MAKESVHDKLSRVRAPRVHITYDVEVGDATELKELPFVMGVLGDFTGQPKEQLPRIAERKFVDVTPDNFDKVLEKMNPHLAFSVPNRLNPGSRDGQISVDLDFAQLTDFDPDQIVERVEPLKKLRELRTNLADLRGSLQGNMRLDELLHEAVSNTEKRQQLSDELGIKAGEGGNNG